MHRENIGVYFLPRQFQYIGGLHYLAAPEVRQFFSPSLKLTAKNASSVGSRLAPVSSAALPEPLTDASGLQLRLDPEHLNQLTRVEDIPVILVLTGVSHLDTTLRAHNAVGVVAEGVTLHRDAHRGEPVAQFGS